MKTNDVACSLYALNPRTHSIICLDEFVLPVEERWVVLLLYFYIIFYYNCPDQSTSLQSYCLLLTSTCFLGNLQYFSNEGVIVSKSHPHPVLSHGVG